MAKKIIIAGAGHGGLVAGAYLAKAGYDVEIFEKAKREELGHDWHDTMKNNTFELAGIKDVDSKDIHYRKDNVFFPPSLKVEVVIADTPKERVDFEVDRKVLYKYLIDNATANGVKINYEKEVKAPIIDKYKVVGLVVDGKKIKADLVIDSAGMNSPVIANLPATYNIRPKYGANDVFHTYRAYYNLVEGAKIVNPTRFNVYFKFMGLRGIAWFKINEGMADVLVGSVDPLDMSKVNLALDELRKHQPALGATLLRGGQIKDIPLKSTFTLLVGDNYAAIGDAVSMPLPLNGSGITNSIAAGKMLAETIIEADKADKDYSAASLWSYQVKYFKEIGAKMTGIYLMKNCLLNYSVKVLNFLFEKRIITEQELGLGSSGKELELTKKDILEKIKRGIARPISLLKLKNAGVAAKTVKQVALSIPDTFDSDKIEEWRKKVETLLK